MKSSIKRLACLLAFSPLLVFAQESVDKSADEPADKTVEEVPMHFESKGSVRIDGKNIAYNLAIPLM